MTVIISDEFDQFYFWSTGPFYILEITFYCLDTSMLRLFLTWDYSLVYPYRVAKNQKKHDSHGVAPSAG